MIGLDQGGLHSAEALLLARYFMFSQVYFHRVRQVYDQHLLDFLSAWLPDGQYPDESHGHLQLTDSEVLAGMRTAARDTQAAGHDAARRVVRRDHFRRLYEPTPEDTERHLDPAGAVARWATARYGGERVRRVSSTKAPGAVGFPVRLFDGQWAGRSACPRLSAAYRPPAMTAYSRTEGCVTRHHKRCDRIGTRYSHTEWTERTTNETRHGSIPTRSRALPAG